MTSSINQCDKFEIHHIFHGLELHLHASGAIWLKKLKTLLIADLHLEKGSSLAQKGMLIPPYDTRQTLEKLDEVMAYFKPEHVITLGDNFHDHKGPQRLSKQDLSLLNKLMQRAKFTWIEGNHDNPNYYKSQLSVASQTNDEIFYNPVQHFQLEDISLIHDAAQGAKAPMMVGHLHPLALLKQRNVYLRKTCFFISKDICILPSFGSYTGGLNVRHDAFSPYWDDDTKIFMLNSNQVVQVPITKLVKNKRG